MKDLGKQVDAPTAIFADNQELAKNAKYHSQTRHIDICHHFVLQKHTFEKMRVGFIRRA